MSNDHHHNAKDLSSDLLHGARQIAAYLFGSESRVTVRKVYYLAEADQLPVFRLGRAGLCARRSTIQAWIEAREAVAGGASL